MFGKIGSIILKLPSVRNCFTLSMTDKLVVIIISLKLPKIKKILLYEMKFLLPNYSCLQNPWLGGLPPPDPRSLCPLSSTEFVEPPPNKIPGYATASPHRRFSSSSFNFQYYLVYIQTSSSCLNLLPRLPINSSSYLSFNNMFYKAVPTQDVTNLVNLSFVWFESYPSSLDSMYNSFISHTFGPTDLHPFPVPPRYSLKLDRVLKIFENN